MQGQIKNKFDLVTLKKILLEAAKLVGVTAGVFILTALTELDFGPYTLAVVPVLRWFIGNLEQFKKGE